MKVRELSKMIVGLTVLVLASVPAYSQPAAGPGGAAGTGCCICLSAAGDRNDTSAASACRQVDWGDRCPADRQFVCGTIAGNLLCLKDGQWKPYSDVFQENQCGSLTAIINAQDIDPSEKDGTLKAANMCMHALYKIESETNAWNQCVHFLGACNANNGKEFAYTCARVREASKFRTDNPQVPEEVFTITREGLPVSAECLGQLDGGTVGGGTYKFTVKKGGTVEVTVCENGTCSTKGFNEVCPKVTVKVTVHVKPDGGCQPCENLKQFLNSKGIDFQAVLGGAATFPVTKLSVDGTVKETIDGFASAGDQGKKIMDAWTRLTYPIRQGDDRSK